MWRPGIKLTRVLWTRDDESAESRDEVLEEGMESIETSNMRRKDVLSPGREMAKKKRKKRKIKNKKMEVGAFLIWESGLRLFLFLIHFGPLGAF